MLLNNTPERHRKADGSVGEKQPLRFIYAVRDSVFSKIDAAPARASEDEAESGGPAAPAGAEPALSAAPVIAPEGLDEAAAETRRANGTKFFDVVIPLLVPFISHRNARDLLASLLEARGITGIDARLVNTVARHCTDMRLMRNVCNDTSCC